MFVQLKWSVNNGSEFEFCFKSLYLLMYVWVQSQIQSSRSFQVFPNFYFLAVPKLPVRHKNVERGPPGLPAPVQPSVQPGLCGAHWVFYGSFIEDFLCQRRGQSTSILPTSCEMAASDFQVCCVLLLLVFRIYWQQGSSLNVPIMFSQKSCWVLQPALPWKQQWYQLNWGSP